MKKIFLILIVLFIANTSTAQQDGGFFVVPVVKEVCNGEPTTDSPRENIYLSFRQSIQACTDCSISFDSMYLLIKHSLGIFRSYNDSLFLKKSSDIGGSFIVSTAGIPKNASIKSATLYMRLNRYNGIANKDNSSLITLTQNGRHVRNISVRYDIRSRGYSNSNPLVPIDLTPFVKGL